MIEIVDSFEQLPNGTQQVRWHLLEDYELVKPVERFLRSKWAEGSAIGTLKTYAEKLKSLWEYLRLKELNWQDFKEQHLPEFAYWYLTGGVLLDSTKNYLNEDSNLTRRRESTTNQTLTVVTQFYNFHIQLNKLEDRDFWGFRTIHGMRKGGMLAGHLKQSPIRVKKIRYREPRSFPGCLTSEQIMSVIDACRNARDKLMIWLLAELGLRKGELLGLHLSDINWNKRTISIIRRENNPNDTFAKGRNRDLSIASLMHNPKFCELVSQYFDDEYPHEVAQRLRHDMVFVVLKQGDIYGHALGPQNLNKLLNRLKKKTGIDIERLYPHLFRHNFATHNIRQGRRKGRQKEEVAKTVQRQLGHSSINVTLDVYDHSFSEAELAEEINRLLDK